MERYNFTFFFSFLPSGRGITGGNDSVGGDGSRGLSLQGVEDPVGRFRGRSTFETRPRVRDLQPGGKETGVPELERP